MLQALDHDHGDKYPAFFAGCNWAADEWYFLLRSKIDFQELFKDIEWLNPYVLCIIQIIV